MGAWGHAPFENDTACDWAYDLEESQSLEPVRAALLGALADGGVQEADAGCEAVAAAAALARLGHAGEDVTGELPGEVAEWAATLRAGLDPELASLAVRALDAVLGEDSELAELWDDEEDTAWRGHTEALRTWLANAAFAPTP